MPPTVLHAVPVDRIAAQAQDLDLGRAVLNVAAAVPYGVGWLAGRASDMAGIAVAAVRLGWREARAGARPAG